MEEKLKRAFKNLSVYTIMATKVANKFKKMERGEFRWLMNNG